jgi:hypothetical protein
MLGIVPCQQRYENAMAAAPKDAGTPGFTLPVAERGGEGRVELGQAGGESAHLRVNVGGVVADGEVAPGRGGVHDRADDPGRVLVVGDEVQHRQQHDRNGLAEVECLRCLGQDGVGVPDVGLDVAGCSLQADS